MGPVIHMARGSQLTGLPTSSEEKTKPFQKSAPGIWTYAGYEALLEAPNIDAIHVPPPNHMHREWAMKALKADKHVLVEKPVGMTTDEIDVLIAERDLTGFYAAEAFMIVHHPQWQNLQELIASGEMGALRHVTGVFTYDNRADPENIRNRAETGGGGLRDIGVYVVGGTRFAAGKDPFSVSGHLEFGS